MTTEQSQSAEEIYSCLIDIVHRMERIAKDPGADLPSLSQAFDDFNKLCADIAVAYYNARAMPLARKIIKQSKPQTSLEILAVINQIDNLCYEISSKLISIKKQSADMTSILTGVLNRVHK